MRQLKYHEPSGKMRSGGGVINIDDAFGFGRHSLRLRIYRISPPTDVPDILNEVVQDVGQEDRFDSR